MAEIKFESYKTQPFYLHHNFQDFYKVYINNESNIKDSGKRFLNASIEKQKKREEYLYKALGIDQGNWPLISKILFGIGNDTSSSKLDYFLQKFISFIDDDVNPKLNNFLDKMDGKKISEKEAKLRAAASKDTQLQRDLKDAANKFIEAYNDPVKKFKEWLIRNNEELDENQIMMLSKIFTGSRSNRGKDYPEFVQLDGTLRTITDESIDRVIDFLRSTKGFIGNIVGDTGEEATISFMNTKEKQIEGAVIETITGTSAFGGTNTQRAKLTQENIDYYTNKERIEKIKQELRDAKIELATDDEKLKFWFLYSDKNTETLTKNLKADEIFKIEIVLETGEKKIENYGISSKTSYTDSGDLKIYSGSFFAAFENMFKSSSGLFDAGIIGEIINFLIYSIFNAYGSGTYGSYENIDKKISDRFYVSGDAIEEYEFTKTKFTTDINKVTSGGQYKKVHYVRDLEGNIKVGSGGIKKVNETNTNFFMEKVRPLYTLIIQDFAYQWLTGGVSSATHADFFSVFSGRKHYFIPMSVILEAIRDSISNNDFILSQDLLPTMKTKSPLELKNYKSAWTYEEMEKFGKSALNSGSGKSIIADKNKLFNSELIKGKLI